MEQKWDSLLTTKAKKIAIAKIDEIAIILSRSAENINDIALMGDGAGLALFLAYYGRYKGSKEHQNCCNNVVEMILGLSISNEPYFPFAGGISGMCWTVQHLNDNGFIEADIDELFSDLDAPMKDIMLRYMNESDYGYDFLHGSIGIAFYLLKRKNIKCRAYVELLFNELKKKAIVDDKNKTVKWESPAMVAFYDFGLAHGLATIVNFLSRYIDIIEDKEIPSKLLRGLIKFMRHNEQDPKIFNSYFPSKLDERDFAPNPSRLAWCYGDLGIGISLFRASETLDDYELKTYSLKILSHAVTRIDPNDTKVEDAGLCHGAMGNALIFNRLYNMTGQEEFKKSAVYWYDVGLDMGIHKDGLAGYKAIHSGNLVNDSTFLNGITGIGLSLISAVSNIEPRWDECLLIS